MRHKSSDGNREARSERRIHSPARSEAPDKLPEIARCPSCEASYRNGRWTWVAAPAGAYEQRCPACQRIEDDYPAGLIELEGAFVAEHRDELVGLVRNVEERERSEHPLKRVMAIADAGRGLRITTTDGKLVEAIGKALQRAYDGRFEHGPTTKDKQNLVRGRWVRD